jgi:hypothetical protein
MSPYGRQLILLNSAIILRQMKRYLSSNEQLDNADKRNYLVKSERENSCESSQELTQIANITSDKILKSLFMNFSHKSFT